MRIAIGGLHIESCTFSPLLSQKEDFKILREGELLNSYPFINVYSDISIFPVLYARALPGGPIEAEFYQSIKREFLQKLEEIQPLDGLFLHMHGAVSAEGMEDAEGDLLSAIRAIVGEKCFIAASYDLHGNLSQRVIESVDFLSAYRTAPHVDWYETLQRVFYVLIKCLKENISLYKCFISVPILLPGEQTSTEWEPAASLYQEIKRVIDGSDVIDASILIGYVWADELRSSASVVAYGLDERKTHSAAKHLAKQFWDARNRFQFGVPTGSVDDCIQIAQQSIERPVVISDSGDNPTAGGAGDTPYVLERMLSLGVHDAVFASIADNEAVAKCEAAGTGRSIDLSLGGKLDPIHASAANVNAKVESLHILPWTLNRQGDDSIMNRIAVVDIHSIKVILTERRTPFHRISDFTSLDIDPYRHQIIVVKIGYLEPELKALAAKSLLALSPGAVNQDITSINYQKIHRPKYPFDPEFDWSPIN